MRLIRATAWACVLLAAILTFRWPAARQTGVLLLRLFFHPDDGRTVVPGNSGYGGPGVGLSRQAEMGMGRGAAQKPKAYAAARQLRPRYPEVPPPGRFRCRDLPAW